MQKQKLLLLGGSHAEVPLIQAAQRLGFHVITTGNRALDIGHRFSDQYIFGDFSNSDEMLQIARGLNIDAVCSGCNDFAAISASYVADVLSLGGHDTPQLCSLIHHKDTFYSFSKSCGVPVPSTIEVHSLEEARGVAGELGFPILLKPVDLTGGKGISKITSIQELSIAWETATSISRSSNLVLQRFIEGTNHAVSVLIKSGNVVFQFFDNEHYYANKYMVGGASFPSSISDTTRNAISNSISKLVKELNMVDGLLHLQFIVDDSENHFFIDVCRRAPGDLYIELVELAAGVPYPELIVRAECSIPFEVVPHSVPHKHVGRLCLTPPHTGVLRSDPMFIGPGTLIQHISLLGPGDLIDRADIQKIGIYHIEFADVDDMLQVMNNPWQHFHISIDQ